MGKGGVVMVVVVAYAPDLTYDHGDRECGNYSQRLGERAAATTSGEQAAKWKPGGKPSKPTTEQTKHPKRLLMADLVMHLKHYALKINCTLVLTGAMNTDLYAEHRKGKDVDALVWLLWELNLVSCAAAA